MQYSDNQRVWMGLQTSFATAETGWPSTAAETVKRVISGIVSSGYSGRFWIGIGSGGAEGTYYRWLNKYKDEDGVNCMRIVYKTDSEQNRRDMEKLLIDHYSRNYDRRTFQNGVGGGGGADGVAPFTVYIAYTKY